jgi:prevent-host-death family protein
MIPITRFNRGEANKIFDEVESSGYKVVVKNNKPACVLISPEKYEALMEMLSDYQLLLEARKRMEHFDRADTKTQEEVMGELGLTEDDLDGVDVEIE